MLIFERFRCKNAGPYKEIDLNLKNQGLVRMMGPNGAGKSSAWNLFTQNFYATSPKKATKADVMATEKEFLLETTFRRNDSLYVAAQSVKCKEKSPVGKPYGTGVYLFRDGEDISMHRDPDTQKLIRQTLGWTLEEWYGYIYLAQGAVHKLITGTRSERQTYLSALFNLTPLDTLNSHFKLKAEDLSEKILQLEKEKQEHAVKISLLNGRNLESLTEERKEIEETTQLFSQKLEKLRGEQEKFLRSGVLKKSLEEFKNVKDFDFGKATKEYEEELSLFQGLQADFVSSENLRSSFLNRLEELRVIQCPPTTDDWDEVLSSPDIDVKSATKELEELRGLKLSLKEVSDPGQKPKDLEEILASPDIDLAKTKKKIAEIKGRPQPPVFSKPTHTSLSFTRSKISDLKGEIKELETEIKRLQLGGDVCPHCGSALDCADRGQKLEEKQSDLFDTQENLEALSKKLRKLEVEDEAWRAYEALGPDLSVELPELENSVTLYTKKLLYKEIKVALEKWVDYQEKKEKIKGIEPLQDKLSLYSKKKEYQKVSEQIDEYKRSLSERKGLEDSLEKLPKGKDHTEKISVLREQVRVSQNKEMVETELFSLGSTLDQTEKVELFKKEIQVYQTTLGSLDQQILEVKNLNSSIETLQASISAGEKVYKDQKKYSLLAKAYGKAGQLRELQISKYSKYLEEALLCHTMKQFPEHKFSIQVEDGIDILTSKNGSKLYDVSFMSGGEQGALSVAFLFALDDLFPPDRRANLKIVDETEAWFDGERKQDFIQYILPELKKRAETVIVISHSDVANQGAFDKVWEVKGGVVLDHSVEKRHFEAL